MKLATKIAAVTAITLGVIQPSVASAKARLVGSGIITALDCAGGLASIVGSYNRVRLFGYCTKLTIRGSGNSVSLAFGRSRPKIWLIGSRNDVLWETRDGSEPRVTVFGIGNNLTPPVRHPGL
jgi:hypothetical protein